MSKLIELREALITWRRSEIALCHAILSAQNPDHIRVLKNEEQHSLQALRILVDSEPWAEIAMGE